MRFLTCSKERLTKKLQEKKIVCVGCSKHFTTYLSNTYDKSWLRNIEYFVDNNCKLQNTKISYCDFEWDVYAFDKLKDIEDRILVITTGLGKSTLDIFEQLKNMNLSDSNDCYSLFIVEHPEGGKKHNNDVLEDIKKNKDIVNEKIIHCFWFSGEEKPKAYLECINSWKKCCPDYEIIEWNLNNYDISKNRYMKQAYEKKMWAFVSDYARLDVVYNYGGIYLDMDVELLKNIDAFLKCDAFFSFDAGNFVDLGSGFGAKKGNTLVKLLLDQYKDIDFIYSENEIIDFSVMIPQPTRLVPVFESCGMIRNGDSQRIKDGYILSEDYFRVIEDPDHMERDFTGKEYAIHWHNAGWFNKATFDDREAKLIFNRKIKKMKDSFQFRD